MGDDTLPAYLAYQLKRSHVITHPLLWVPTRYKHFIKYKYAIILHPIQDYP